jgi:two-component system cell cycle response regulator
MSSFNDSEICRGILESLPTGLCVVDMQKKIVFWSDGAERVTGHLRHDVIGHSCIAEPILHCDQPGCEFCGENCPVAQAMKMSRPTEGFGFLHHKAGYEVPVRIRAVPVHNARGSIIGAVETFEDLQQTISPEHRESLKIPGCVDEVTALPTRARMLSHLRHTLATFVEVQVPFGLICVRLEGWERFRASMGQEAANGLLRVVARSLEGTLWITDFVGRWSDDQFLAIINGCQNDALSSVRERVRRTLANDSIEWWGERRSLPISIGEATAQPDDSAELLLERVQKSLDAASAWRTQTASASLGSSSSGS